MPHVSISDPLAYEPKRFGSDREVPAKRPMRPYAERLQLSDKLVKANAVPAHSSRNSALMAATVALFIGAIVPIITAIPAFGNILFGFIPGYDATRVAPLAVGWWGALLVVVAGVAGVFVMRTAAWKPDSKTPEVRFLKVLFYTATVGLSALLLLSTAQMGANGSAALGAVSMLAVLLALYGCWCTARRENWLGAITGGFALFVVSDYLLGSIAVLLLLYGAKAFPGQVVARHPWKRTEVALEPLEAPAALEADPEGTPERVRMPFHQGLFAAKVALVFGAFGPFVLALPWFGIALFGPLILLLWPLTIPLVWSAASLQASFIILWEPSVFGPLIPGALFTILWLLVLPVAGGLIGARAVGRRSRPWAAVAGALMLIVGGRLLFGVAALIAIGYTWSLFDADKKAQPEHSEAPPQEGAPGASAH